jgi:carbon storage regulator
MLVLSRKENERVFIGDEIVITILGANGKTTRIGIEAPAAIQIQREELRVREKGTQPKSLVRLASE